MFLLLISMYVCLYKVLPQGTFTGIESHTSRALFIRSYSESCFLLLAKHCHVFCTLVQGNLIKICPETAPEGCKIVTEYCCSSLWYCLFCLVWCFWLGDRNGIQPVINQSNLLGHQLPVITGAVQVTRPNNLAWLRNDWLISQNRDWGWSGLHWKFVVAVWGKNNKLDQIWAVVRILSVIG